jgi:uncharacterized lipoprotein YddW (UPF0748 family)
VLYNSRIAPRLTEWKGFQYPPDHDLLAVSLLEGRRRGLKVYASINVFSEAHKLLKSGPLYQKPELQATVYDAQRTVETTDGATWAVAVGENIGPNMDEIASYDSSYPEAKRLGSGDAAVVVRGVHVESIIDGSLTDGGAVSAPPDGYLLVGRGTGARWLLDHAVVGQALKFTVREVLQPILQAPAELVGGFVNPANPTSRAYALSLVEELANSYPLDGIVFDRMRYASLKTDFSQLSRDLFEAWLGKKLDRFPQDIYEYAPTPGQPLIQGPYFREWLEWRAKTIRDFLQEARDRALRVRSGLQFSVYVGSWYDKYYPVGVNWGAPDYRANLEWMTPNYAATGYAPLLTWLSTGCYYGVARREDARQLGVPEDRTVEAAAETSVRAVNDAAFVYAGLYVLDYKDRPEEFRKAIQTAVANSQGVMLFDFVYIEEYNWWNILTEAFSTPRRAPHDVPGLQAAVLQTKRALEAATQAGAPTGAQK